MKSVTPELKALLASQRFNQAELFTLTTAAGDVLRVGSLSGLAVRWQSQEFASDGITIERGTITSKLHTESLDVDNVDITLRYRPELTLFGQPVATFVRNGGLNGARVLLQKAFCAVDSAGNTDEHATGVIFMFEGRLSDFRVGRSQTTCVLIADTERLNQSVPSETINLNCMNTHYDARCGLDADDWTDVGVVQSATTSHINATLSRDGNAVTRVDDYFTLGRIVFNTGVNAGAHRTVRRYRQNGQFDLIPPLDHAPGNGDTFSAVAGCDLSASVCANRFDNAERRRCFKWVPPYEENL